MSESTAASPVRPTRPNARRQRFNRWMMVMFMALVACGLGALYLTMHRIAAQRAQAHAHTFDEYVITHHVGELTTIDDGTGIDPASYVLTLDHPVPVQRAAAFTTTLMKLYVTYDRGQILTLVYLDPKTGKRHPIAEAEYNDDHKTLSVTVSTSDGVGTRITRHVDW